jgi:hypothetical protein
MIFFKEELVVISLLTVTILTCVSVNVCVDTKRNEGRKATMNVENSLDVKSLCSRKLWEMLVLNGHYSGNYQQQLKITQELVSRRHYLREIKQHMPVLNVAVRH